MKKFTGILILSLLVSSAAYAADATSISTTDVTAQAASGGGGIMTGAELFSAAIGKSTANNTWRIGSDGYIYVNNQRICGITSGACSGPQDSYGNTLQYFIQPGGLEITMTNGGAFRSTSKYLWK